MRVSEILRSKGNNVITTTSRAMVNTTLHRLRIENVGALVVSDDRRHPDGIISERDIVRALSEHGCEVLHKEVRDVMTRHIETCKPDSKLTDVMATMTRRRFRHMPVISDTGELVGIVSIGDIVKHRLEELEMETQVLRDRVIGSH